MYILHTQGERRNTRTHPPSAKYDKHFNSVVDPKFLFVPAPVTNFRVQDPDPAHIIDAYLEKKKLKFNQEEEFTSYLPFSISH